MFKQSRSIATTLALSAAILGGTGVYTTTFADKGDKPEKVSKAQKLERSTDTAVRDELVKELNALLSTDGPAAIASHITKSDRVRVEDALKKETGAGYQKYSGNILEFWKKTFGHDFDPSKHLDQVADTDNIKHFTYENRDYASVIIPKSMWGPEAELRYLKQGDTYRLQLANDLTGDELAMRFRKAVERLDSYKQQWTKDEDNGYEVVSTILLGTLDYDAQHTNAEARKK